MTEPHSVEEQRRALHEGALVLRMDELGTLVITGADRQSWLNGLLTCDLAPLKAGAGAYGLSVAKNGKIQAEVWLVLEQDRVLLGAPRERVALLGEVFERHLIMEDAELSDASEELGWIFAVGPRAGELIEVGRGAGAHAGRADWTGLGGAIFAAPRSALEGVEAALCGREGTARGSGEGWEALRVEHDVGRYGVDFDDQNYPQEASLEDRAVSFSKGCYLGQETVFMLQHRGKPKKRLVQIEVEGEGELAVGAEVELPDGTAVGSVTSRTGSPVGGAVLALGYVKFKHAQAGVELRVAGRRASVRAARGAGA
ncbi:MAG TPA: glycine cleavage T C-terminal barrel domain-containing protein [Candidatus Nanopelagicales bacterium]|nr:glycine cleavage T C-terminal barrel domain-containing protein [Candidatus Nanopelagicales bacterium]